MKRRGFIARLFVGAAALLGFKAKTAELSNRYVELPEVVAFNLPPPGSDRFGVTGSNVIDGPPPTPEEMAYTVKHFRAIVLGEPYDPPDPS